MPETTRRARCGIPVRAAAEERAAAQRDPDAAARQRQDADSERDTRQLHDGDEI
jgi:hypothetical protein